MMDILDHRCGPEPVDMQFNGVDFNLQEMRGGRDITDDDDREPARFGGRTCLFQ